MKWKNEQMFYDERGFYVSMDDLLRGYAISEGFDGFEDYIAECCGKNGTLTPVNRFHIDARERGGQWSTVVDDCDDFTYETREDAEYEVECMKELDREYGETYEYRIVDIAEV